MPPKKQPVGGPPEGAEINTEMQAPHVDDTEKENQLEHEADALEQGEAVADEETAGSRPSLKKGVAEKKESAVATKEVQRKRNVLQKLHEEKEVLAKRVKTNRDALRVAEQELEELETVARKKARLVMRMDAEKNEEHLKDKAIQAKSSRASVNLALKVAKQRVDVLRNLLPSSKNKASDAARKKLRAQTTVNEAVEKYEQLKAQGVEVPEEANDFKDLSAPGAWKPPGVLAAKVVSSARAALAKVEPLVEKADAAVISCEERLQTALARLEATREKQKAAEERKQGADSALASVVKPMKLKAKPAANVIKTHHGAKAKPKAKPKAKVKAKAKAKTRTSK